MDRGATAMKEYSIFLRVPLTGASSSDGLMSCPGHSLEGVITLLQRCSRCILRPLPNGLSKSECARLEQRSVMKILMAEKYKPCENYKRMCDMYVPYSQLTLCAKWTYNVHNDRTYKEHRNLKIRKHVTTSCSGTKPFY